jgi:hypothetical protein
MPTHRHDKSTVCEYVALFRFEGLTIRRAGRVAYEPFVVLYIFSRHGAELRCQILRGAAHRDAQASCAPVSDREQAKIDQKSLSAGVDEDIRLLQTLDSRTKST